MIQNGRTHRHTAHQSIHGISTWIKLKVINHNIWDETINARFLKRNLLLKIHQ